MKSFMIVTVICATLLACSKEKNSVSDSVSLVGNWKEYEAYSDPGDGSGTFREVDGIVLNIKADSTYTSNSDHYVWGKSGSISLLNDSTIYIHRNQSTTLFGAGFSAKNGGLQILYTCIEGCGSRFKKLGSN